MSVELDPVELGFKRPFNQEVSQVLRLQNPHSDPVAFKVKTTAPKQYCVRPNSGRIEAGQDVEVQVLLQAMKEDPPLDARCRDKFLVQSIAITANQELNNVSQIWSNIEQTSKSSIHEKKIRVSFLPADGQTNGVTGPDVDPPAYSSPSPSVATASTPQRSFATGPTSTYDSKPNDARSLGDAKSSAHNPEAGGPVASISSAVPTSQDDLKKQLEAAKAEIIKLKDQASEGLRQRNVISGGKGSNGSSSTSLKNAPAPGGVPVQIVAALCLLCFLIACLFF
ncbi:VAMP-associated protein [Polychaeton citri CBS 116435]|uniref:VAMP-associated protein n=1 Tax=Polychaeton citri CBS 116435 TaxID=1314669 RepID=A0A9P4UQ34_9PEZI|nr:VAMP-associated protein [Polychaeton citri CBS 116435]